MNNVITVNICANVLSLFFYPQFKNKPCFHWAYAFILEFSTVANTGAHRDNSLKLLGCLKNSISRKCCEKRKKICETNWNWLNYFGKLQRLFSFHFSAKTGDILWDTSFVKFVSRNIVCEQTQQTASPVFRLLFLRQCKTVMWWRKGSLQLYRTPQITFFSWRQ
jgi:hypothetical protein